jgi:hypothetical protein
MLLRVEALELVRAECLDVERGDAQLLGGVGRSLREHCGAEDERECEHHRTPESQAGILLIY